MSNLLRSALPGLLHAFVLLLLAVASGSAQSAEVRFLDVGQGDAILVRSDDKVALIDAGPRAAIADRLEELGVEAIDLLIISHPHADHLGGAGAVLERFPVHNFLDNGKPYTTIAYRTVMELVEEKGIRYLEATDRVFTLGDLSLSILPPPARVYDHPNPNNQSVGVLVEVDTFSVLLTGDSEVEQINAWLESDVLPTGVTVLKAAHHGARNGVTPAWLDHLQPEFIVISVAERNGYGHPHAQALRYYRAGGRTVLRTDRDGDVVFYADSTGSHSVSRCLEHACP